MLYTFAMASRTLTQDTQLFHDVFNASPIGIAVENLEGHPLFVNPSFCSFLGFSEEELRNKHCVDFSLTQPPKTGPSKMLIGAFGPRNSMKIEHIKP